MHQTQTLLFPLHLISRSVYVTHTIILVSVLLTCHSPPCRFLIGREKPGAQSEVARLISETLEQERQQQQVDDVYEQSTEEVSQAHLLGLSAYICAFYKFEVILWRVCRATCVL